MVISTVLDFTEALQEAGEEFRLAIKKTIMSSMDPPNSPATKKRKGHGRTLRDSDKLLKSIEVRPDGPLAVEIGTFDPKVAEYASFVHDGTKTSPPRPYIAVTVDLEGDKIADDFEKRVADEIDRFLD